MTADANTRKAEERARKRAAGLYPLEVWAPKEAHAKIIEYARKQSRVKKAPESCPTVL